MPSLPGGEDGPVCTAQNYAQGADVIGMFVGQGQSLDLSCVEIQGVEALADLAQGDARVDEERPLTVRQGVAVPLGTRSERRIVHGPGYRLRCLREIYAAKQRKNRR